MWRSILGEFELNGAELAVLRQAVRAVDRAEALAEQLHAAGLVDGDRLSPLASELRSTELTVARLVMALRVPVGGVQDEREEQPVGQHRGLRGVYGMGAA